jgi:uncharacterized phiE125 gp8 family phage protein
MGSFTNSDRGVRILNIKLITDATVEPVSLAEVKLHLRLDTGSIEDDLTTYQSLPPASRNFTSVPYNGASIDILNKSTIVNVNAGTNQATGRLDVHIEESDDNITFTDWTDGEFAQITTANDNAIFEKEYTGSKRYIRAVGVVSNASCEFSVDVVTSNNSESVEDTLLNTLITVAREYCENFTRRALATKTLELILCDFPNGEVIELPQSPVASVTSIKYKDSAGTETTWANTNYILNADVTPAIITPIYGGTWPSFTPYPTGAVRIRYVVGETPAKSIKQAMLLIIGDLYENRENSAYKELYEVPMGVKALLWPYKIFGW